MSLWASADEGEWQAALDGYDAAVAALGRTSKGGRALADLDRWFHEELSANLSGMVESGKPPKLSHDDLVKLVDWKLTRGKWRPRLLDFAKSLPAGSAEAASQAAFDLLAPHRGKQAPAEAIREALKALTVLKGIGPATASAVLEAYDPSIPFLSDDAQLAALGNKDYTEKAVLQLTSALRQKATELSSSSGRQWSAKEVEMCLFARAVGQGGEAVTKVKAADKGKAGRGCGEAGAVAGTEGGSSKRHKR